MTITSTPDAGSAIISGIERMNQLLTAITGAQMGLDTKMMKADIIAQVTGLGQHFDTCA